MGKEAAAGALMRAAVGGQGPPGDPPKEKVCLFLVAPKLEIGKHEQCVGY